MSDKRPATDGDRLPWLGPMPGRTVAPGPRAAVRGLTLLVVLLTVALTGTLSLILLRGRDAPTIATPVQPASTAKVDLPAARVAPPPLAPVLPTKLAEAQAPTVKLAAPAKQVRAKSTKSVKQARAKKRRATPRRVSRPQVRVHRGVRNWPVAPRGRVIQLGAFNSAGQADVAWRSTVRDYTYLGTLPRKITPVRIGPRRKLYYRLQVATPSPRHAVLICRVVRATRRACIVT